VGFIDFGDTVAGDPAHVALFEIGHGLQVDSHCFDKPNQSSAGRAEGGAGTVSLDRGRACEFQEVPS
jgi:hypothetical protein